MTVSEIPASTCWRSRAPRMVGASLKHGFACVRLACKRDLGYQAFCMGITIFRQHCGCFAAEGKAGSARLAKAGKSSLVGRSRPVQFPAAVGAT